MRQLPALIPKPLTYSLAGEMSRALLVAARVMRQLPALILPEVVPYPQSYSLVGEVSRALLVAARVMRQLPALIP
jgi:hypothetical protein